MCEQGAEKPARGPKPCSHTDEIKTILQQVLIYADTWQKKKNKIKHTLISDVQRESTYFISIVHVCAPVLPHTCGVLISISGFFFHELELSLHQVLITQKEVCNHHTSFLCFK